MPSSIEADLSHAEKITQDLIKLLEEGGTDDYIGESISQLEHSLQCAHYAKQAGIYTLRMSCYYMDKKSLLHTF
jgi:predicted HD phosphohydrolase